MSSKPTTIVSFHHKCYRTRSMRVYVFKTHCNLQFSPQMLHDKINEGLCLQNPPQSSVFSTNATKQIDESLCLQNHHNRQFSPQMLPNQIDESLCLQNPLAIFSFHHKCYMTKSMRVYVFKTHHNLQFSPQMLQNKINEDLCLQNPPQFSVFATNAT